MLREYLSKPLSNNATAINIRYAGVGIALGISVKNLLGVTDWYGFAILVASSMIAATIADMETDWLANIEPTE